MTIYRITNDDTCVTHEGSAKELAEVVGTTSITIQKVALEGKKISGKWSVKKVETTTHPKKEYVFPVDLLIEWDEVTKPFKILIARKRNRRTGYGL